MRSFLLVLLASGVASAAPVVDWETGRVVESGVGLADRQAPNAAGARGPAKRKAEDAARRALKTAVMALPIAPSNTASAKTFDAAAKDPAIAARLDRAIAAALTVSATPETDGAWTVTLAVPLESLRQALVGPRTLTADGDKGPAVIVVEGAAAAKPVLGTTIGGASVPIVWVKKLPAWAAKAPRIKARAVNDGAIDADTKSASPSTLFVVLQ